RRPARRPVRTTGTEGLLPGHPVAAGPAARFSPRRPRPWCRRHGAPIRGRGVRTLAAALRPAPGRACAREDARRRAQDRCHAIQGSRLHRTARMTRLLLATLLATTSLPGWAEDLTLDCLAEPAETVAVGSPVTGIVRQVMVGRGDRVQAGDVLARLD